MYIGDNIIQNAFTKQTTEFETISYESNRAVNKFYNLWLDAFTHLVTSYCVKLYVFKYVKKTKLTDKNTH